MSGVSGDTFPIREGIPSLIFRKNMPLRHRYWEWVYNQVSIGYDLGVKFGWRLSLGGAPITRQAYIDRIEIKPGDLVLETAIGTGGNLALLPEHARYFGLDISFNMLRRCQSKLAAWERTADLIHGDVQALPFYDNTFDVVYHMGGIQFLQNPALGIREMQRVARPGAGIWVIDETDAIPRTIKRAGQRSHPTRPGWESDLQRLIPPGGENIQIEAISNGELYCLKFRKGI